MMNIPPQYFWQFCVGIACFVIQKKALFCTYKITHKIEILSE
jgi:hypothetical protein